MEENKKILHVLINKTLRNIVNFINTEGLQKEDVFSIIKEKEGYTLLYFK